MTDTTKRILVGGGLFVGVAAIAGLQYLGLPAVRVVATLIALGMIAEMVLALYRAPRDVRQSGAVAYILFTALLVLVAVSAWFVATRPWIMLLMLMIISCADMGAWMFGRLIGGDKMWEKLSANKTWAGQIAGIICGTVASVMYGLLGADTFMPQLLWIGISIALMSQYGDLTASWIKRKLGIKDYGHILPGHGGVLDRFDGWIYALPLVWLVML